MDEAIRFIETLPDVGVDFDAITDTLQVDGVDSFADAYAELLTAIEDKRGQVSS
jgi:hypothetical protein